MEIQNGIVGSIARTYSRQTATGSGSPGSISARTAAGKARADSVSFSSFTQELQRMRGVAEAQPDMRSERVNALKASIGAGTYQVDLQDLASKMIGRI
jgi:flagellar biosynthesis anti-sigma factor FlgM